MVLSSTPSMESDKCCEILVAVIDGSMETLTIRSDVVVGRIPNVRNEDAIYIWSKILASAKLCTAGLRVFNRIGLPPKGHIQYMIPPRDEAWAWNQSTESYSKERHALLQNNLLEGDFKPHMQPREVTLLHMGHKTLRLEY